MHRENNYTNTRQNEITTCRQCRYGRSENKNWKKKQVELERAHMHDHDLKAIKIDDKLTSIYTIFIWFCTIYKN